MVRVAFAGALPNPATDGVTLAFTLRGGMPADAVVLDLMMPDADGYEVMRRMKANPATASLPIVIVSATALVAPREVRLMYSSRISPIAV